MIDLEIKNALLTTRLCQFLKQSELNVILKYSEIIDFTPNEFILYQGKECGGLYVIIEGSALVTAKVLGEGSINLVILGHGNFIGEISLFEQGICSTSVVATSQLKCLFIKRDLFEMLSLFHPEIKYQISRAIMHEVFDRLKNVYNKITNLMSISHMASLSFFGVMLKSLKKTTLTDFENLGIDLTLLKSQYYFNVFNKEEMNELIKYFKIIEAAKDCVLIHEGEKDTSCYILLQGAVQCSIVQDNKFAKLLVMGPITLFCSMSIIDEKSTSIINHRTCERAILLKLDRADLETIQKENIQLWYKIFDLICKSFVELEKAADKLDIRLNSELYNR